MSVGQLSSTENRNRTPHAQPRQGETTTTAQPNLAVTERFVGRRVWCPTTLYTTFDSKRVRRLELKAKEFQN